MPITSVAHHSASRLHHLRLVMSATQLTRQRRFARGLAIVSGAAFMAYRGLFVLYANTKPRLPDPSIGRIHSINNHGKIAYLNGAENLLLDGLVGTAVTLFGIAFAVDRWKR